MVGRLFLTGLIVMIPMIWQAGCTRSLTTLDGVVVPAGIRVSSPKHYPAMPAFKKGDWQPQPLNFQTIKLANGIQVFLRTIGQKDATALRMVMPYKASLKPAAAELLSQFWLMGDTKMVEQQLCRHWQQLGSQQVLYNRDNQVVFHNRIKTNDLYDQLKLMAYLLSERDLQAPCIERQWRIQRVLSAAQKRTAIDLSMPFYRQITWQKEQKRFTFSNKAQILKSEYSKLLDRAFCMSRFRLYIESDIPYEQLHPMLSSTLATLGKNSTDCSETIAEIKGVKEKTIYLLDKRDGRQVEILFGLSTVPRNHKDWEALTTLSKILGGGSGGRLFQDLRERQGLTYGVYAQHRAREGSSDLFIRMKTKPNKTAASLKAVSAHIQKIIDEPVFSHEIETASATRQGDLMQQLDHSQGRLAIKSYSDRFEIPVDELLYAPSVLLPPNELQDVARRYLETDWQIILVGDENLISTQLARWFPSHTIISTPCQKAVGFKR